MTSSLTRERPKTRRHSVDLTLSIDGAAYSVRPIPPDPLDGIRAFRLRKSDGTLYDVAQTQFGPECDCPDFVFRRAGLDPDGCKHVRAMTALGLIDDHRVG